MTDHDQLMKALIREFFADFLRLFFADWAARFDLTHVEWLDKELLPDPPDGSRHLLDLVAKLRTKEPAPGHDPADASAWLAVVHIEIESPDKTTLLKPRLPRYYIHLRDARGLPVLPIVLYLKVGLDGIGVDAVSESFWELEVLTFRYLYVGLPGLDAVKYVAGSDWLGVALAALMKVEKERIRALGREALERIKMAPLSAQQRYLLAACVDKYLPLDEAGRAEFEKFINADEEVRAMAKGIFERAYDEGVEKGRSRGFHEGQLNLICAQLERRFGTLPERFVERLNSLPTERLVAVGINAMTAKSLEELGVE
ncbi:MAG: DUF4351 domain-containing protein [Zavarzinella sp.]|nr:DUF4351 domain-containing protein [Zavarzinella sp.]